MGRMNTSTCMLSLSGILALCLFIQTGETQFSHVYDINEDSEIDVNDCPLQCTCEAFNVTCVDNYLFPIGLPGKVEHFTLRECDLSEIAANSFQNLPRLQTITIEDTKINTIRACAFAELEQMTSLSLRKVTIHLVEGNAFSNLNNISVIEITDSDIHKFQSYAFHNFRFINTLRLLNTNVSDFAPYTFRNISNIDHFELCGCSIANFKKDTFSHIKSIGEFKMSDSKVGVLHCETITKFRDVTTKLDIINNTFTCDCQLMWMLKSSEMSYVTDRSRNNVCQGKSSPVKPLSDVDVTSPELCTSSDAHADGCPRSLLPTPPYTCTLKFDTPLNPDDQVDYPPEYTTQGHNRGTISKGGGFSFVILALVSVAALLKHKL